MHLKNEYIRVADEELHDARPAYNEARETLRRSLGTLKKVVSTVSMYKPGDSSEKAVYVLAQVQLQLEKVSEALQTVKAFESKEKQVCRIRESLPIVKTEFQGA